MPVQPPPPLTEADRQRARQILDRHLDEQVEAAEQALARAEQAVRKAHAARARAQTGDGPTWLEAVVLAAAAGQAYTNAACAFLEKRTGTPEAVEALRADERLLRAYLQQTYGHDTSGKIT